MGDRASKFPFKLPTKGRAVRPTRKAAMQMGSLLFTCPDTNQRASTGVETDVQSLRASWTSTLKIDCPQCGKVHEISVRDTYINGALDDAANSLRGAR